MPFSPQGLRVHPDWRRQWQAGESSPYPGASPHDIAWRFAREIDRKYPDGTIEDDSIDTGLLPPKHPPEVVALADHEDGVARETNALTGRVEVQDEGSAPLGIASADLRRLMGTRPFDDAPIIGGDERIKNLRENAPGRFSLEPMKEAPTLYRGTHFIGRQRVEKLAPLIEAEAERQGVDPDLVRAIVYAENARGWFKDDVALKQVGEPLMQVPLIGPYVGRERETILPMNIHRDVWRDLVDEDADFFVPEKNIKAGVTLIKRIADRLDDPSPEKIATLYNQTNRNSVTPWGDLVGRAYAARAWALPHWTQRPDAEADRVPRKKWADDE